MMKYHSESFKKSRCLGSGFALAFLAAFTPCIATAETTAPTTGPAATAVETSGPQPEIFPVTNIINLGTQKEGPTIPFSVQVLNKGQAVLKILNVRASCGCTSVSMNKEEIPPGGQGRVGGYFATRGHPG